MRRLTAILIISVVLVASVGPVFAQSNNSSVTGNSSGVTTNGTTSGVGGVTGNATSSNETGGNTTGNATNGSVGTGMGAGTGGAAGAGSSGSSGESSYGSGYLSDTLNNNTSSGQNGSISFGGNNSSAGNGTNNSSASGLNSDADGVKGIAINAALDVVARFLKFIANSITTAMDFLIQNMVGVLTWTPHPPRGDMYMAAANQGSDSLWGGLHNQYRQLWQPFALLAAAFLTFMSLVIALGQNERSVRNLAC